MSASPGENGADGTEPPSDDLLAAELVLGVVDPSQRRGLQERAESDRSFAERIAYWERRFAPWLNDVEAVEPPSRVWTKIRQSLGWTGPEPSTASLRGSLALWRTATALAVIVAAVAIALLVQQRSQPPIAVQTSNPPQGQAVTALWRDDGTAAWLVSIDRARGTVSVVPVPGPPDPQGRVPELWVIPMGKAPLWVATVSTNRSSMATVPTAARRGLVAGSMLAISLEPPMPETHAGPTGPIVAKGGI
jgi:anti-sigma-K factor RskA